jgi:hypothetical protein
MHIGIAVTTYNRPTICNNFWKSVLETITDAHTYTLVCAVDGGDTKGLELDPRIQVLKGPRIGIAGNKSRALHSIRDCDYVFIFDDDMVCVKAGWVELYIDILQSLKLEHICHFCEAYDPNLGTSPSSTVTRIEIHDKYTLLYTNNVVPGVLLVSSKKCVAAVGAYDPRYRLYGYEHADWTRRAAQAGMYIQHPQHVFVKEALEYIKSDLTPPSSIINDDVKAEIAYNGVIYNTPNKNIYIPFEES